MELEVLGIKLKVKPDQDDEGVAPQEIVEFVRSESLKIKEQNPNLDDGKIAVLVALDLAKKYKQLMREYQSSVKTFKETALSILQYVDCEE